MSGKRQQKKSSIWLIAATVVGLIVCVAAFFLLRPDDPVPPVPTNSPAPSVEPTVQPTAEPTPEPTPEPVDIPVDFTALQGEHPDIYAWVRFPGTQVDYPIVQRFGEDDYYLRKDLDGNYDIAGSIYTQFSYNTTTMDDPVTVIYGHDMRNESMFGGLQPWGTSTQLSDETVFYIYQPGRRLTYRVFATVPYSTSHILYYYNFHEEASYNSFFDEIYNTRSLYTNLDESARPQYGDRVVILSTCFKGTDTKRYLVMGVLVEDTNQAS